jgi:hypothetical protein
MDMIFAQVQTTGSIVQSFSVLGQNLSTRLFDVGMALYIDTLGPLALDFARAVFPIVLMAELMFVGFRIILKESFIQQFFRIILITIINFVIIYEQFPQQLLIGGMMSMESAGKNSAVSMITSKGMLPANLVITPAQLVTPPAGTSAPASPALIGSQAAQDAEKLYTTTSNPVVSAWGIWIGDPSNPATANQFKYSPLYIHNVLFGGQIFAGGSGASAVNTWLTNRLTTWSQNQATNPALNSPIVNATNGNPTSLLSNVLAQLGNGAVNIGALMVAFFSPLQFLTLALTLAAVMLAGLITPGLTAGTILGSAYLTFFITLAMGTSIVPFAYFRTLEKSWNKWLRVLLGMALVPFIYYIFGAIGFIFSVDVYDVLFGSVGSNGSPQPGPLANVLATAFNYAISESMLLQSGINTPAGGGAGTTGDWLQDLLSYLTFCMQFFAQNSAGAIITTTFITMGCTFPAIALKVASNWESGFAEPGIMDQLQGGLNQVQGAIGQGFSTGMQGGLQTMSSIAGKLL